MCRCSWDQNEEVLVCPYFRDNSDSIEKRIKGIKDDGKMLLDIKGNSISVGSYDEYENVKEVFEEGSDRIRSGFRKDDAGSI